MARQKPALRPYGITATNKPKLHTRKPVVRIELRSGDEGQMWIGSSKIYRSQQSAGSSRQPLMGMCRAVAALGQEVGDGCFPIWLESHEKAIGNTAGLLFARACLYLRPCVMLS
jgi:hypothetical protein